jgi:polyisoprenoid-binding protein YceI
MLARFLTVIFGISLCAAATADPVVYTVDSRHTFPSFEVRHFDFSLQRGRFNNTSGHIVLDQAAKKLSAEITIDATSIDTGLEALEKHLRKADFFDAEKHPNITFKSTTARFSGDTLTALDGELTLRGVTKPVTLNVSAFRCAMHPVSKRPTCGAEAIAHIKRSDFGIVYGLPAVADDVKLLINIEAAQQ